MREVDLRGPAVHVLRVRHREHGALAMFVVVMRLRVFVDDDARAKAAVGSAAESRLLRQMRPSPEIIVLERDLRIACRERMKMAAIVVAVLLDQIAAVAANSLQASRVGFVVIDEYPALPIRVRMEARAFVGKHLRRCIRIDALHRTTEEIGFGLRLF